MTVDTRVHILISNKFLHIFWNNFVPSYKKYGIVPQLFTSYTSYPLRLTFYYSKGEFSVSAGYGKFLNTTRANRS